MQEKELAKLDGQSMMLEQQKLMIESANFDVGVVSSIKAGKDAIGKLNKEMNVDDIAELKDELDDMMAENAERQDYFADIAKEGQDELLGELDELEAEMAANDLNNMDLNPAQPIINKKPVAQAESDEEDEVALKKLMLS